MVTWVHSFIPTITILIWKNVIFMGFSVYVRVVLSLRGVPSGKKIERKKGIATLIQDFYIGCVLDIAH